MNRGGDAIPAGAFAVPVSRAGEMQRMLDTHHSIRLDTGGDYRRATGIILRTGQAIYGAAGTRMGRLIVQPGTSDAVVSGVIPESLEFPPSQQRTHDNCFERFGARFFAQQPLRLANAVVESNLFLDGGSIVIDTSRGGRVSNNRFIRTLVHGVWPALQIEGRDRDSADRNVFLWMNVLGAKGDGIILRREAELNLIAFDAENWNQGREGRRSAMLSASELGTLRIFLAHGGDPKPDPGAFMDVEARRFELIATNIVRAADPAIRLHENVEQFVDLMSVGTTYRDGGEGSRLVAFRNWTGTLPDSAGDDVLGDATRRPVPWEPPVFEEVPAPAGKNWRGDRTHAIDMRAALQSRIDREGIVTLPAGIYHVSGPLRLRSGQGIIGAGAGRTAIVGLSDDTDLIVGGDQYGEMRATSFVLIDLTLQGGRAGIRHDAKGAGRGAQFNLVHLSHVVLRDLTEAGIVVDGIYGWDNNLIDHVTFHHMPAGVRQIPNPLYAGPVKDGDIAGMNYMDKNVFFRCRFEDVGTGLQLLAKRANGLNACIECRFSKFSESAIELQDNVSTLIANSDFIGSGSGPVIRSNQRLGIVASRFSDIRHRATVMDADVACDDCRVTAVPGAMPNIASPDRHMVFTNSHLSGAVFSKGDSAILIDTAFDTGTPARVQTLVDGRWRSILEGVPHPVPSLLIEWPQ